MQMLDLRGIFQRKWVPELFLDNNNVCINAIINGRLDKLIKRAWNNLIYAFECSPEDYKLEFEAEAYRCSDNIYFCVLQLPEIENSKGHNLAVYAMAVFSTENKIKPRFFLGETDYYCSLGRFIFVTEPVWENDNYIHNNYGTLTDDFPMFLGKKEVELDDFIKKVLSICNVKKNLKKYFKIQKKEEDVPMYKGTELFTKKLEDVCFNFNFEHYDDPEKMGGSHDWIGMNVKGENINSIPIEVFFSETDFFSIRVFSLCKVNDEEKIISMLKMINELNQIYMYVKFCLNEQNEICVSMDSELLPADNDYASRCYNFVVDFVDIVDESYPKLMKVLWN